MRTKILLVAVLAVAAFGTPADAACEGCGGAAAPRSAALSLNGSGVYTRHALSASCHYTSTPNGGSHIGTLSTEARATSTYDPSIAVSVSCSLIAAGGNYSVQADGTNATPYEAYASDVTGVPAMMRVDKLCLTASATWTYGSDDDAAYVDQCINPGLWGQVGVLTVEVPFGVD